MSLRDEGWSIADDKIMRIITRLSKEKLSLKEFIEGKMYVGLKTGLNDAFIINNDFYKALTTKSTKYKEIVKPYGVGRDLSRYGKPTIDKYIICIPNKWTDSKGSFKNENDAWDWLNSEYELISEHLKPFEKRAKMRTDQGKYWWELRACDYYNEFEKPKIVYPEIATNGRFSIDEEKSYFDMTSFIIGSESKELLGILNSKLINFLFRQISSEIRGGFLRWKRQYVYKLPIPKNIQNEKLSNNVELAVQLKQNYDIVIEKFSTYFSGQYKLEKLTKKLENWYELTFTEFIAELNKAIKAIGQTPLTKKDEFDWIELFEENKTKAQNLKSQIETTENEIDKMVYELYGLSKEEIEVVKNS